MHIPQPQIGFETSFKGVRSRCAESECDVVAYYYG